MNYLLFIIGLIFGSFYNVVGMRLPNKESIVRPGSHCRRCDHKLSWYENIPVFSYLFLLGKCRKCKERISALYPAIELLTGILFVISYQLFGISANFYISLIIASLIVLIFITDSVYMIILDEALLIAGVLIFIIKIIYEGLFVALTSLGYGLIIFIFVYGFMIMGNLVFKKESLGGGDIKLSFIAGMVLGPVIGFFYIILASFLAFPYAVYVMIKNEDGVLPFGPFLVSSMYICFCNTYIISIFLKKLLGII